MIPAKVGRKAGANSTLTRRTTTSNSVRVKVTNSAKAPTSNKNPTVTVKHPVTKALPKSTSTKAKTSRRPVVIPHRAREFWKQYRLKQQQLDVEVKNANKEYHQSLEKYNQDNSMLDKMKKNFLNFLKSNHYIMNNKHNQETLKKICGL
jgi:nitrogen fixation protein FixH